MWLAVLGLLNSAVAAYYYLRILVVMYMHEPSEAVTLAEPLGAGMKAALGAAGARNILPRRGPERGTELRHEVGCAQPLVPLIPAINS